MPVARPLKIAVAKRAGFRCEYCHLPLDIAPSQSHIDHIISRQHGGKTALHNLAFCCSRCNFHKGPNLASVDPRTKRRTFLFNPRRDEWLAHFERRGARIIGKSAVGRATAATLDMNEADRVLLRSCLIAEALMEKDEP